MEDIREISMAALLASLFVVMNMLPFSAYIGGPAFITASVVIIPLMAYILSPKWAVVSGLAGGAGGVLLMMGPGSVMGPYAILIPGVAAGLGSLAFHAENKFIRAFPAIVLFLEYCYYMIAYNGQATPFWGIHYMVAIVLFFASWYYKPLAQIGPIALTTMLENAMMNIGSIALLALPAPLWIAILPASLMERTLATIGSFIVIVAVDKSNILTRIGWKKK